MLALQRTAGNQAVARMLQREPAAPEPAAPPADAGQVLQSPDPAVDGRGVDEVGADLLERDRRYRAGIDEFKRNVDDAQAGERDWYGRLDLLGEFIDLFNAAPRTDPARWDLVRTEWDGVAGRLDAALAVPVSPATINALGANSREAIERFDSAYAKDQASIAEFSAYLQGYTHALENVEGVSTIVRDVSFAGAVGIAVVIAAPAAFATVAATGVGTAASGAVTVAAMAGMGGAMEGGGRAIGALLVEGGGMLEDLVAEGRSWNEAVDAFDYVLVGKQGWDGMKRGFVDGVLAYAGLGLEKVLGAGASVAIAKVLGAEGAGALSQMLRRALQRALASGVTGGVIGALDAGAKASLEGRSVADVGAAMESGFALGALGGAVLGTGVGVWEDVAKARVMKEIAELSDLLVRDPDTFAVRYRELVESLTPEQRAAWDTELAGRRFVDKAHYEPAKAEFASGATKVPPEHRYGESQFRDWAEAAQMLDEHARTGQPLTQAELQAAHRAAARDLTTSPGTIRDVDAWQNGSVGVENLFSVLSPEQLAVLESNPHMRVLLRGVSDPAMTAEQVAAKLETAWINYPEAATVQGKLDAFFEWYASARGTLDPTALAARSQRELISIHPFTDGNGRVTRLVMDHALQSRGLPPALLEDTRLDLMGTEAAWVGEVRKGVVEAYESAVRHADLFNQLLRAGDLARAAFVWGSILGLSDDRDALLAWLYPAMSG